MSVRASPAPRLLRAQVTAGKEARSGRSPAASRGRDAEGCCLLLTAPGFAACHSPSPFFPVSDFHPGEGVFLIKVEPLIQPGARPPVRARLGSAVKKVCALPSGRVDTEDEEGFASESALKRNIFWRERCCSLLGSPVPPFAPAASTTLPFTPGGKNPNGNTKKPEENNYLRQRGSFV